MKDGDIVIRPTNSNFNKREPCTLLSRLTLFQLQYLVILSSGCGAAGSDFKLCEETIDHSVLSAFDTLIISSNYRQI